MEKWHPRKSLSRPRGQNEDCIRHQKWSRIQRIFRLNDLHGSLSWQQTVSCAGRQRLSETRSATLTASPSGSSSPIFRRSVPLSRASLVVSAFAPGASGAGRSRKPSDPPREIRTRVNASGISRFYSFPIPPASTSLCFRRLYLSPKSAGPNEHRNMPTNTGR